MNLIQQYAKAARERDALAKQSTPSTETETPTVPIELEEPEPFRRVQRAAKRCAPPVEEPLTAYSQLGTVRHEMLDRMKEYILDESNTDMLLFRANAGIGKTYAGVGVAHWVHNKLGKRVFYQGPRHDFYPDIIEASHRNGFSGQDWKEMLPRQKDQADPAHNTCRYAEDCNTYMAKGYPGNSFCQDVCGKMYMKTQCPYHAQFKTQAPLIYGQHMHLVTGHPLASKMSVVIGDENPMNAFLNDITIPANQMHWSWIERDDPLAHILHHLEQLAQTGGYFSGYNLLDILGMDAVLEACREYDEARLAKLRPPRIHKPEDAQRLGYNVLQILIPLLRREAEAAIAQRSRITSNVDKIYSDFNERIIIDDRKLSILSRHYVSTSWPGKMIWFDATGNPELYAQMFQRKVELYDPHMKLKGKIYQVPDRTNSKSSLMKKVDTDPESRSELEVEFTTRAEELKRQIERIIEIERAKLPTEAERDAFEAAVIVPKNAREFLGANGHFFGNRGTNAYEECDVLIVAGTPMPPLTQIERLAKCLWYDEMEKFDNRWVLTDRAYNYTDPADGDGWSIPVNEYADPRLNVVLWQQREAEIIQSAHRARILTRDKPVYLLTNLPVHELPPTRLIPIRELMGAPDEVHTFKWQGVVDFADALADKQNGVVTQTDLMEGLGISNNTARKYLTKMVESGQWQEERGIRKKSTGRPSRTIRKSE